MRIEEVTHVEAPPKARVEDANQAPRARDYLDGFLRAEPPKIAAGEPEGDLYEAVVAALKDILRPRNSGQHL